MNGKLSSVITGAVIGLVIGRIAGAAVGALGSTIVGQVLPAYGVIIVGLVVGALGGVTGGMFGAVREFTWKASPTIRSIIGAFASATGWTGGLLLATIIFFMVF